MSDARGEGEPAGTGSGPTVIDVTPAPSPEPAQPAEAPRKSRLGISAAALATLIAALATSPYWAPAVSSILPWGAAPEPKQPPVDATALEAKLAALSARIAELAQAQQRAGDLDQRITKLEQRPAAPAPNPQDAQQAAQQAQALAALGDRLSAIEQRVSALAAATAEHTSDAEKALQTQVQALAQKLDQQAQLLAKLQGREAGAGSGRIDVALALALGRLRTALATSRPYAGELQAAEAIAKDEPETLAELRKLEGRAQQGIPTVALLAERFPAVSRGPAEAAPAPAPAPAEGDWRSRALAKIASLVTVRRVGEPKETGAAVGAPALSPAVAALQGGDLAAAVAEARRADGQVPPALASWLEDAQARLDAEAALAAADAILTKRLLAGPGAGAKP